MSKPRDKNGESRVGTTGKSKKPYVTPELFVHGKVEKITEELKGSGAVDGGSLLNPTYRSV